MSTPQVSTQDDGTEAANAVDPPCAQALRLGCILVAFLIPLKLLLAYIVLIPIILVWAISSSWRCGVIMGSPAERSVTVPLVFLLLSISLSAVSGIDPFHSISPLLSLLFFALAAPLFRDYGDSYFVPLALVTGQAISSAHTVLASTFPETVPSIFIGAVSESGQLALTFIICLGLAWNKFLSARPTLSPTIPRIITVCGALVVVMLSSLGFRSDFKISSSSCAALWIGCALLLTLLLRTVRHRSSESRGLLTLSVAYLPLLLSALLLNLKRGPWFGVIVGTGIFCLFFARRFLALVIVATVIIAASVPPIRERLAVSYDHFTISGGRSTIWRIGGELISQYPLGIGYHNSGIMRKFSLEIPQELKHFHNNVINIAAESGILTACIFCWFIFAIIRVCFKSPTSAFHVAIGCAFISWQTAGLVEYNFGDSEVMIIVWMLLGILLGDLRKSYQS